MEEFEESGKEQTIKEDSQDQTMVHSSMLPNSMSQPPLQLPPAEAIADLKTKDIPIVSKIGDNGLIPAVKMLPLKTSKSPDNVIADNSLDSSPAQNAEVAVTPTVVSQVHVDTSVSQSSNKSMAESKSPTSLKSPESKPFKGRQTLDLCPMQPELVKTENIDIEQSSTMINADTDEEAMESVSKETRSKECGKRLSADVQEKFLSTATPSPSVIHVSSTNIGLEIKQEPDSPVEMTEHCHRKRPAEVPMDVGLMQNDYLFDMPDIEVNIADDVELSMEIKEEDGFLIPDEEGKTEESSAKKETKVQAVDAGSDEVIPQVLRTNRKRNRVETETNPTVQPAEKKQKKEKEEIKQNEFRERTQGIMTLQPPDDSFLFCEDCNKEYDVDCPIHGPLLHIQDRQAVTAGTELLVWYGDDYGKEHRSLQSQNTFLQPKYLNGNEFYSCQFCEMGFTNAAFCAKHLLRSHSKKLSPENIQTLDRWLITNEHENSGNKQGTKVIGTESSLEKHGANTPKSIDQLESMLCKLCKKSLGSISANSLKQQILAKACKQCSELLLNTNVDVLHKQIKCNICQSVFGSNQVLKQHMMTHTGEKPFKCSMCDYACNRNDSLQRHMMTHTGEKPFKCIFCDYACSQNGHLKNHMRTHTREKPFKCSICDYACNQRGRLKRHMRIHTGEKPFKCTMCDHASKGSGDLRKHMRIHTGEKPIKCTFCDYTCKESGCMKKHTRLHTGEKSFICNICGYAFNENGHLKTHMMTHTGEKPFKCKYCDYASKENGELKRHMRTHKGEKRFKCSTCGYACKHSEYFKRHMRTHTGEKPFKCEVCDYACNESGNFKRHMRIHTGEKPFKCVMCDYTCKQSGELKIHMRIHTGEKPFKCNICDYACNQNGSLKKHMWIHTGEKPFKCDMCKYACSKKEYLKKHMRIHTGE